MSCGKLFAGRLLSEQEGKEGQSLATQEAAARIEKLTEALAEVFADHGKANSLAWMDKAAAALTSTSEATGGEGE